MWDVGRLPGVRVSLPRLSPSLPIFLRRRYQRVLALPRRFVVPWIRARSRRTMDRGIDSVTAGVNASLACLLALGLEDRYWRIISWGDREVFPNWILDRNRDEYYEFCFVQVCSKVGY